MQQGEPDRCIILIQVGKYDTWLSLNHKCGAPNRSVFQMLLVNNGYANIIERLGNGP